MKNIKVISCLMAVLFFVVSSSFVINKNTNTKTSYFGGWVQLGEQVVSAGVDLDILDIPEGTQSFKRLKFKVLKASVYIKNVQIVYNDNTSESHIISRHFNKGHSSRILELIGRERIIKRVIFNYHTRKSGKQQAHLVVMAKL